jgi:hypothetical protein
MSGTPFSGGQLTKLRSHIDIGVATALPKITEKFPDPKRVLKAFDGRGEVFAGHLETVLEAAIKAMFVLIAHEPVTITLEKPSDPTAFYQTRTGLWIYGGFSDIVTSKAKPVNAGTTFKFNVDELGEAMTDAEIEAALPKNHLFDESAVCAIVAEMISKQPNGEAGDLLNNGYANLLYTASCVVNVRWYGGRRRWYVYTCRRGGRRWFAGDRVLSPSN